MIYFLLFIFTYYSSAGREQSASFFLHQQAMYPIYINLGLKERVFEKYSRNTGLQVDVEKLLSSVSTGHCCCDNAQDPVQLIGSVTGKLRSRYLRHSRAIIAASYNTEMYRGVTIL
ncbi:hypothetical protein BDB00DRAFT_621974 [Zychaea mexicana]|uniref:uncharacterized protein n=1 Tax=Zychaea mexicana TaxID=64656 RepID=UPI0022FEE2B9|nr:uncharacterized protein BDB00DRAFT_621974 [Zychaea mexicana]KAI9497391.1 hypothetical protein BDB00DRAFT_621974 [Zychaea mexicana]